MIPGSFEYHRPRSLADAVRLLGELGDEARPLAGGHSLIPMMKLRLAHPQHLVDLGAVGELKGVSVENGALVVGATTTLHELLASALAREKVPLLAEAVLTIADPQVRYVGTVGGNLANGDPGNDLPAVMLCLDAIYRLTGPSGERGVRVRDFYRGAYVTAAEPGEILTAVVVPVPPAGHGHAYEKLKRKVGDYATAAAAVVLTLTGGKVATCAIGLTNLADTPLLAEAAAAAVVGTTLDDAALRAASAAAEAVMAPAADGHGPAEYRTHVGGVMVARALKRAAARAG